MSFLTASPFTANQPAPTVSVPTRRRSTQNPLRAALLALALMLGVGTLLGGGTPAGAATSGNVAFCLKYANGTAYANKSVYLYRWNGSSWGGVYKSGSTNAQGCATWKNLPTNSHYATQGYWTYNVGSAIYAYNGWTGSAYLSTNGGTVNQSTGTVGLVRLY